MRFRNQLAVGIGAQIALTTVSIVLAVVLLRTMVVDLREATRNITATARVVHDLRADAEELVTTARGLLLTGDAEYAQKLAPLRKQLLQTIQPLRASELAAAARAYTTAVDAAMAERHRVNDLAGLEAIFERRLQPHREQLENAIEVAESELEHRELASAARIEKLADEARLIIGIASAATIALALLLGVIAGRRLSTQYRRVEDAEAAAATAAAARQELLDIVAHDLRSPLSTILLGVGAAREDADSPHLAAVERAAQRMQRLVDDLLDSARAQRTGLDLAIAPTSTREVLALAAELFARRAARAEIDLRVECEDVPLDADRDRLVQILGNLIGNAFSVTPAGASITLGAHPTPGGVRFSVRDMGPGLKPEQLDVFEPYRQGGKRPRGSLGLGLYISKILTEAHGGTIGVDRNSPGCTFWFDIPVSHQTASRANPGSLDDHRVPA